MANQKKKKQLNISDLDLTREQLIKLLGIQAGLISMMVHNLMGAFGGTKGSSIIIAECIREISKKANDNPELLMSLDEWNTIIEMSEYISSASSKAIQILDSLTSYRKENSVEVFVSKPYDIIQEIQQVYSEVSIKIKRDAWRSLEIIYPENILTAIIQELTYNAIKNCGNRCSIILSWKIQGAKFHFELHDNGQGISPRLGEAFLPLSQIGRLGKSRRGGLGLNIVDRIITGSGGILLFKHSPILGGTLVFFELPIFGYYKKGQTHDFTQQ